MSELNLGRNHRWDEPLPPAFCARMPRAAVDALIVTMLRSAAVRSQAVKFLRQEYFRADEAGHALLARVIAASAHDFAGREDIPQLDIRLAVDEAVDSLGEAVAADARAALVRDRDGLIRQARAVVAGRDFSVSVALKRLERFVGERAGERRRTTRGDAAPPRCPDTGRGGRPDDELGYA